MQFNEFRKSGHMPTLLTSFFYFDVCFAVWVLNGAMAPFISESLALSASQKALLISMPILSGALLRLPLGLLAQRIGRKSVSMLIMAVVAAALVLGWTWARTFHQVLAVGLLLGVGGASFGVALSLGSGSFPAKYKGLAMGIAGAGNSGTVFAALFGPLLAGRFGWPAVYGFFLAPLLLAMAALAYFAKEPADGERKTFKESLRPLFEKDTWVFNLLYVVTFGGFIGLTNFLPSFFHDHYGADKVAAGRFTAMIVLMGSAARVAGGWAADRVGGIRVLEGVLAFTTLGAALAGFLPPLPAMTVLLVLVFAGLGVGNGSVFQLVPLRYGGGTALASSVIGEVGSLGGLFIPTAMAASQGSTGSFRLGFCAFAALAAAGFVVLRFAQSRWTGAWIGAGGKAKTAAPAPRVVMEPVLEMNLY